MNGMRIEDGFRIWVQIGLVREELRIEPDASIEWNLDTLKDLACSFVDRKFPEHSLYNLRDKLLLFRHDSTSPNLLQLLTSVNGLSNRSLIEIVLAEDTPVENLQIRPHALNVHSYKSPHFCDFCGEMLFGLVKQGLKCEGCRLNVHKRCAYKIANNCSENRQRYLSSPHSSPTSNHNIVTGNHLSGSRREMCRSWSGQVTWVDSSLRIPHTFNVHNYTRPTMCHYCKRLLKGLFRQGLQCKDCNLNVHKKCALLIPRNCQGEIKWPQHGRFSASEESTESLDANEESSLLHQQQTSQPTDEDDDIIIKPPLSPSTSSNIPLMRVVQSVRQTKRAGSTLLREGWLVHYTLPQHMRRRHYWKLDVSTITMYKDEFSTRYYREIELSSISEVVCRQGDWNVSAFEPHVFELHVTGGTIYYVGCDPSASGGGDGCVASPESGVGLELAKSWQAAIHRALMPLTPQPSISTQNDLQNIRTDVNSEKIQDVSQLYHICADEILGSGQFGIVYGGKCRASGKDVAVKVIDKLRFPTKQEAQLKNEVSILQNLRHPGVVHLQKMFETNERIFVIMEKLEGDMLEMILSSENGRLSERHTRFLISQILVALKHLHSRHIVHCDLKPENVLLSQQTPFSQVKLCDFGFARIIGEKSFRRSVVGTPAYLAPEVLQSKGYNRSLDMWSVGVVIYVSLSGTFPFNEDEEIPDQIQNAAFMFPHIPWHQVSQNAIDLICQLLQVKMRKRFTVDKSLAHNWLQNYECWCDLRKLEAMVGERYLTHESDDARWEAYRLANISNSQTNNNS